jgi:hypothetical protein
MEKLYRIIVFFPEILQSEIFYFHDGEVEYVLTQLRHQLAESEFYYDILSIELIDGCYDAEPHIEEVF